MLELVRKEHQENLLGYKVQIEIIAKNPVNSLGKCLKKI